MQAALISLTTNISIPHTGRQRQQVSPLLSSSRRRLAASLFSRLLCSLLIISLYQSCYYYYDCCYRYEDSATVVSKKQALRRPDDAVRLSTTSTNNNNNNHVNEEQQYGGTASENTAVIETIRQNDSKNNSHNGINVFHKTATRNDNKTAKTVVPKMYTYYERTIPATPQEGLGNDDRSITGMTGVEDEQLLDFWKASWSNAGWDPVVLSERDAARHPKYAQVQTALEQTLHLDGLGRKLFMRWLAMAAVGGGWMSDYDVFPLVTASTTTSAITKCHHTSINNSDSDHNYALMSPLLPNGGALTVYDVVTPSLASGSAVAWFETLLALLQDATDHVQVVFSRANNSSSGDEKNPTSRSDETQAVNHQLRQRFNFWSDTLRYVCILLLFVCAYACMVISIQTSDIVHHKSSLQILLSSHTLLRCCY